MATRQENRRWAGICAIAFLVFRPPAQVLLSGGASRRWRSDDQHNMLLLAPTIAMLAWPVAQRPPARSAPLLMSGAAGTAAGGGGDLSGGNDEERNAQLASLRNMMFAAPEEAEAEAPGTAEVDPPSVWAASCLTCHSCVTRGASCRTEPEP